MSACLHVKINADVEKVPLQTYADVEKVPLQTYADVVTLYKIRLFTKCLHVCKIYIIYNKFFYFNIYSTCNS